MMLPGRSEQAKSCVLHQNVLTYPLQLEPTNFQAHDVGLNGLVLCPTVPPSDSPTCFGAWRSSVARLLWEQEVAGSNPAAPTALRRDPATRYVSAGFLRLASGRTAIAAPADAPLTTPPQHPRQLGDRRWTKCKSFGQWW